MSEHEKEEINNKLDSLISIRNRKAVIDYCNIAIRIVAVVVFIWKAGIGTDKIFNWKNSTDTHFTQHDGRLDRHDSILENHEKRIRKIDSIKIK